MSLKAYGDGVMHMGVCKLLSMTCYLIWCVVHLTTIVFSFPHALHYHRILLLRSFLIIWISRLNFSNDFLPRLACFLLTFSYFLTRAVHPSIRPTAQTLPSIPLVHQKHMGGNFSSSWFMSFSINSPSFPLTWEQYPWIFSWSQTIPRSVNCCW